jgi:hypothetical protein
VSVLLAPTAPPSLNGGGTSNSGAYGLSWSGSAGANTYNLIENVNGAGWNSIQNSGSQSWSTSGKGNATYYYMVQGCNASGCTNWSNQVAITVSNIPPTPPGPTFSTTYSGPTKPVVKVMWVAQPYATRYELLENNVLVYSGANLLYSSLQAPNKTLTYMVRACNAVGCSAYSPSRSTTP